jgi:hypothetical protein
MKAILDIAAGVVIGGAILGMFVGGLQCFAMSDHPDFEGMKGIGVFLMILALIAAFWLIFVRTGVVSS